MIAFLGMGLLGSNFVRAFRKRGEDVNVWNRTFSRAKAMEEVGAKAFESAADAVKGATRVHICVSDDAAVNNILEAASVSFAPGLIVIDHTTTSASGAAERTANWKQRGFTYIHAPVFMGPQNALDGTGMMLVSGDPEVVATVTPELSKMTGTLVNLGTSTNKAAAYKLLGNHFLIGMTAAVSDTLGLAKALSLSSDDVLQLFETFNPAATIVPRAKRMLQADYANPTWELAMARKDARLMEEAAKAAHVDIAVIPAVGKVMDRLIAEGNGAADWTIYSRDSVSI